MADSDRYTMSGVWTDQGRSPAFKWTFYQGVADESHHLSVGSVSGIFVFLSLHFSKKTTIDSAIYNPCRFADTANILLEFSISDLINILYNFHAIFI